MLIKGNQPLVKKFGLMAVLLGAGDSFHLVPRSYALWTAGLEVCIRACRKIKISSSCSQKESEVIMVRISINVCCQYSSVRAYSQLKLTES